MVEGKASASTFKSDFSMGALDFERYEHHLIEADAYVKIILNKVPTAIQPFFGVLKVLWINFRPIIRKDRRKPYEEKMDNIKKLFKVWEEENKKRGKILFPVDLADSLVEFYSDLLEIKQYIGLGIKVSRDETERMKIERAAGLRR